MKLILALSLIVIVAGCAWFDEQERIDNCIGMCERGICSPVLTNDASSPTRRADCEACIAKCANALP